MVDDSTAQQGSTTSSEEYVALAQAALDLGDERAADELFASALTVRGDDERALLGRAQTQVLKGRLEESVDLLERAAAGRGDDPSLWGLVGLVCLRAGMGDAASAAFGKYEALRGEAAGTHLALAIAAFYALDLREARRRIQEAARLDQGGAEVAEWSDRLAALDVRSSLLAEVGRSHCRDGRYEEGARLLEEALRAGASDAETDLGRALLALDRVDKARTHLDGALARDAGDARAALGRAMVDLAVGDADAAASRVAALLQKRPADPETLLVHAQVSLARRDADGALAACDKALVVDASRHEAWLHRAQALSLMGQHAEARAAADRGIAAGLESGRFIEVGWAIGSAVVATAGDTALAATYGRMVVETVESRAAGVGGEPLGQIDDELAALDDAVARDPRLAGAYEERAVVNRALGLHERALRCAAHGWQRRSEQRTVAAACLVGDLALTCGQPEMAAEAFRAALEIDPEEPAAARGLGEAERVQAVFRERIVEREPDLAGGPEAERESAPEPAGGLGPGGVKTEVPEGRSPEEGDGDSTDQYCIRCGTRFLRNARFCTVCGSPRGR